MFCVFHITNIWFLTFSRTPDGSTLLATLTCFTAACVGRCGPALLIQLRDNHVVQLRIKASIFFTPDTLVTETVFFPLVRA